jgi:4'-phosphopantetheinyl transferase
MNLYWLEQVEADVPKENDWLSSWETTRLSSLRFIKRRADWRLGRWTAKQALAVCLNLGWDAHALASIEIRPMLSGAPEVFVNHARAPVSISLSHREGRAICAIARRDLKVGCDLETIETHSDAFIADYFTAEEQEMIASSSSHELDRNVSLLWSAKESALKTLQEGLRLDTRAVIASFDCQSLNTEGWGVLEVRYGDQVFHGWWQETDHMVRTIVADAPSNAPILLPVTPIADRCCVPDFATLVR